MLQHLEKCQWSSLNKQISCCRILLQVLTGYGKYLHFILFHTPYSYFESVLFHLAKMLVFAI